MFHVQIVSIANSQQNVLHRQNHKLLSSETTVDTTMKLSFLLFAGFLFTTSAGAGEAKMDNKAELREAVDDWLANPTAAAIKYGPINSWDTSLVTNMSYLFDMSYFLLEGTSFNDDISNWDVSAVTDMRFMFDGASTFNQDLSNWDVAAVTDMGYMFHNGGSFNQDLSNWNTGSVTSMAGMFRGAKSFNQDLSNWNTGSVTNMGSMFYKASSFDQQFCWSLKQGADTTDMFFHSKGSFGLDCEEEEKGK
jgi:surface protein